MAEKIDFYIPDCEEFCNGYKEYNEREKLGPIYFDALSIIATNWGNPPDMARGVERIINGWNRFYARFNFDKVVDCIGRNLTILSQIKARNINSFSEEDEPIINALFSDFLEALRRKNDNRASPVSVAKALSPMATNFLPIWDSNIAWAYNCYYFSDSAAEPYLNFCKKMKLMAARVVDCVPDPDDRSLLKRIDEYNYSKYTQHWI